MSFEDGAASRGASGWIAFCVRQLASLSQGYEQGLQQKLWKSGRATYPQFLLAALWKIPGQLNQLLGAQRYFADQTKHGAPLPTRRAHFVKLID